MAIIDQLKEEVEELREKAGEEKQEPMTSSLKSSPRQSQRLERQLRSKDEEIEKLKTILKEKDMENQYLAKEVEILNQEAERDREALIQANNRWKDRSPSPNKKFSSDQGTKIVTLQMEEKIKRHVEEVQEKKEEIKELQKII